VTVEAEASRSEPAPRALAYEKLVGLLRDLAAGAPLPRMLEILSREVEARLPGVFASVLLVEGEHLRHGAAPSLPDGYVRSADHHPIGEGFGSCGTAAHRRQLVVSEDLATDPLWRNYREIAQRYHLASCWSMPVLSSNNAVLATVALYHREPRRPSPEELELIRQFAALTGAALAQHRARGDLTEEERWLRNLVEDLEALVWEAADGRRRFTQVSRRAEQLLGYPAQRFYVEPGLWETLVHPEDREATLQQERESADRGEYELQYRMLAADGRSIWVRDIVHTRGDPVAGTSRRRGVMVNVTGQREAEQEREELLRSRTETHPQRHRQENHLRLLADAGVALGESLEPGAIAQRVAALTTRYLADWCLFLTRSDSEGLRCAGFAHRDPSKAASLAAEIEALLSQPGGIPFHAAAVLSGGESQLLPEITGQSFVAGAARPQAMKLARTLGAESAMVVALPAKVGATRAAMVLVSASADRRYGPADLEVAQELARRTALAQAHARLYLEAQAAIRQREEFLSIAAHELRTPLATLQLTTQSMLLALESPPLDLEFLRARALAAERQGLRLGRLINDLLDVSGIHAGLMRLQREKMDLVAAVAAVLSRLHDELARKRIDVAVHAPIPVEGRWDPDRLEQVITNLISNAVKYGQGRPVRITVREGTERVLLEVEDQGIGMNASVVGRLFNAFERGVAAGHYGGLGLGLYITAQIVRAHGGTITVRSAPGEGSTFTVALPKDGATERTHEDDPHRR
jgi:PAS domain S-box-containing protein